MPRAELEHLVLERMSQLERQVADFERRVSILERAIVRSLVDEG